MIRQLDNGVKVIELGRGTTYISQILVGGDKTSSGICFGNNPNISEEGMNGDEVIIEITDIKGAVSYVKSLITLIETWNSEDTSPYIQELKKAINTINEGK